MINTGAKLHCEVEHNRLAVDRILYIWQTIKKNGNIMSRVWQKCPSACPWRVKNLGEWENLWIYSLILTFGLSLSTDIERIIISYVGFQFVTVVVMNSPIFWDITLCSPLKVNRSSGGTCRLHLQGLGTIHSRNLYRAYNKNSLIVVFWLVYSSYVIYADFLTFRGSKRFLFWESHENHKYIFWGKYRLFKPENRWYI
jgi:hypothetical protein